MKKLMVTLLCAAFGGAQVLFAEASQVQLTSGSYAGRKNLVMQFDAIDNVGSGTHDTSAAKWKDLVTANAGDYDIPITEHGSWNGTALVTDGRGAGALGGKSPPATVQTMEGCYTYDSAQPSVSGVIYSSGLDDGTKMTYQITLLTTERGLIFGGNVPMFAIGNDYSGTHSVCWMREGQKAYYDGNQLAGNSTHGGFNLVSGRLGRQCVGSLVNETNNLIKVKMHAIRFYDRKLTADEVALNSNVDQVRFDGADPATLTWPENSFRYRDGRIEYAVSVTNNNVARGSVTVNGEDLADSSYRSWAELGAVQTFELQATAKPGYRFRHWEDDDGFLTDEQRVSRNVTVSVAGQAIHLKAVFALDVSSRTYVQDGLIMQFDAIENVGVGEPHDAAAGTWKDLVVANAGEYDMTVSSANGSWSDTALVTDGRAAGASGVSPTSLLIQTMEGCYTYDVRRAGKDSTVLYSSGIYAGIGNDAKMIWHIGFNAYAANLIVGGNCNRYNFDRNDSDFYTMCWIRDGDVAFQDGTNIASAATTAGWRAENDRKDVQTIGSMGNSYPAAGEVHAIRLYDRKLPDVVIAFNSNIDQIRFKDVEPTSLTWPEGYRYQEGQGIEYSVTVLNDVGTHGGFTVNGEHYATAYENWFLVNTNVLTITAVPAIGYRFVRWEGAGLTDADPGNPTISKVNPGPLAIKPVFELASIDMYVSKGLVMQFDAIDNVGTGTHDATAPVWKDLVSANAGAYDLTVSSEHGSWNDTALVSDGLGASAANKKSPPATVQTMEGCYTYDSAQPSVSGVIYSSGLDDGTKMTYQITLLNTERGLIFGGNVPMFAIGNDYSGTHSVCWMREGQKAYYDGNQLAGNGTHDGFNISAYNYGRRGKQGVGALVSEQVKETNNPIPVKMHAIRFYDRKLTADEVAFNANIDKLRFCGADPATLTWPAGISYNAERERFEVVVTVSYDESKGRILVNGAEVRSGVATAVPYGNGLGVVTFAPAAKSYRFESIRIGESEPIPTVDQTATVSLFDVRAFKANIRGGGLILLVQ